MGCRDRNLPGVPEPIGDEMGHKVAALAFDSVERRHEIGFRNDAVLHESTGQAG